MSMLDPMAARHDIYMLRRARRDACRGYVRVQKRLMRRLSRHQGAARAIALGLLEMAS